MSLTLLQQLNVVAPELIAEITVCKADYERKTQSVIFEPAITGTPLDDNPVFVIDSAIHTGTSMLTLIAELRGAGAKRIISYGLVLKGGSLFVPTYFGVVTDDKDRTYFELDEIPNNRLHDDKTMSGCIRVLGETDANTQIHVGPPFEGMCVADLLYDKETRSSKVYGYEEADGLTGFISFRRNGSVLFIDGLGVIPSRRGQGISTALCRWAETWGRAARCIAVELWAFEEAIDVYDYYGFKMVSDEWRTLGLNRRFKLMRKPLLYNIKITEEGNEEYRGQYE